jgi:aminoglycoside 6'-N-acetyltransferase I
MEAPDIRRASLYNPGFTGEAITMESHSISNGRLALHLSDSREVVRNCADQIAALLLDFSPENHVAWPTREAALREVAESLETDRRRLSIVAVIGDEVVGWVAGLEVYSHAIELHPLVVKATHQKKGIGRALLKAFEQKAAAMGALTVYLGCDDERYATSLAVSELFPGVLDHAKNLRNLSHHASEFYIRCGYEVVGVIPNANGPGKPDIWLAKPVAT